MDRPRAPGVLPQIVVSAVTDLTTARQEQIIALCSAAFCEDFNDLFRVLPSSMHVLAHTDAVLASHACWVTRWLQPAGHSLLRTAYIEAVATRPAYQGRGFGTAVMRYVAEAIQGYDLAALSPAHPSFYQRLGWEMWQGPTGIRTPDGVLPTPGEEVMILRTPRTPSLDLGSLLTAEWRVGELW